MDIPEDVLELARQVADIGISLHTEAVDASRARGGLPTLPQAQYTVLRMVVRSGGMTPTELSAGMRVTRPMISETVRKLEERGLVYRERSNLDGRATMVKPTDRGTYVHLSFHSGRITSMAEAIFGMSPEGIDEVRQALPALASLLESLQAVKAREVAAAAAAASSV